MAIIRACAVILSLLALPGCCGIWFQSPRQSCWM